MRKRATTARFSARYGRTLRKRMAEIEAKVRKRYTCPNCKAVSVKRLSVGIWHCRKCGHKFAGGAYVPFTELGEASRRSLKEH
jgi:large subunit ribosomal protein L37Ae